MKNLFSRDVRDVPAGAAAAIVALVLAASVVTGRDAASPVTAVVEPVSRETAPPAQPAPTGADADLAIEQLTRPRRDSGMTDLFAPPAPPKPLVTAAIAPSPAKPAPPAAPPLPFRYLGRMVDGSATVVFLAHGNDTLAVRAGETIEGVWRIDAITPASVAITYVPLRIAQQLAIPASP